MTEPDTNDATKPNVAEHLAPAAALTPDLARAALAFLDRAPLQGTGEARTLLHLCVVLEGIARHGSQ